MKKISKKTKKETKVPGKKLTEAVGGTLTKAERAAILKEEAASALRPVQGFGGDIGRVGKGGTRGI